MEEQIEAKAGYPEPRPLVAFGCVLVACFCFASVAATVVGAGLAVPGSLRCTQRTPAAPTTATEITATMRAVRRSIHRK